MSLIFNNKYLTLAESLDNAKYIYSFFKNLNWSDSCILGMLGNMYRESTTNSGLGERGGTGYGLVQWTPKSKLLNRLQLANTSDSLLGQCKVIKYESEHGLQMTSNQWNTFKNISNSDFATEYFMNYYERPNKKYLFLDQRIAAKNYYMSNIELIDITNIDTNDTTSNNDTNYDTPQNTITNNKNPRTYTDMSKLLLYYGGIENEIKF